jgi:F-type H+-transporting ATPase subunit b
VGTFESFIGVNFWTALFVLLNTLAIYFVGKKFLFGPVMQIIADRQAEIDGMYSDAGKAKEEALAMQSEYQQKLSAAQATSERLVKEATERGHNREEEIIRQANAEADAIRKKASADTQREKNQAIRDAQNEISGIALAIAGKVVGKELTDADQAALVDQFIAQLGEGL